MKTPNKIVNINEIKYVINAHMNTGNIIATEDSDYITLEEML